MRHRIPLVTVLFNDGAFGNVRRIQEERYGNRLIASDLANPDFVAFRQEFWRRSHASQRTGRIAPGVAARLRASRRSDRHRSASGRHAEPVGVHPDGTVAWPPLAARPIWTAQGRRAGLATRAAPAPTTARWQSDSAVKSSMQPIVTTSELAAVCRRMAAHPFVTVDTEFLRETTYYPLLCVAQMASTR